VELEAVGGIAVSDFCLKIGRQVDNMDGAERAFLGTDPTADAEAFRYVGDLGLWGDLNAELAGPNDRARLFALLTAFLKIISKLESRAKAERYRLLVCTTGEGVSVNYQGIVATDDSDLVTVDDGNSVEASALASIISKHNVPRQLVRHLKRVDESAWGLPGLESASRLMLSSRGSMVGEQT
jgi:hypothetical protein